MNKFIVWYSNDINKDKFSKEFTLQELISQDHFDYISDSPLLVNYKIDSINDDIGLKDINGKNIYADSSIVEFKNSQLWNKYNGIFFYNKEKLCYQIKIIDGIRNNEIIPYDRYCSDFKIIDTIQENKLGLIK